MTLGRIILRIVHRVRTDISRSAGISNKNMSSGKESDDGKPDHLQRTAENTRQKMLTAATVTHISDISPTVKKLTIKVEDRNFTFKAGQWLDFFIPSVETVGGYSICTCPKHLDDVRSLALAVKYSTHAPAFWIHTQCQVGSQVKVRVGGDFFYDPQRGDKTKSLLLVAGGVGINPLFSIMQHLAHLHTQWRPLASHLYQPGSAALLYSASSVQELIFHDSLVSLSEQIPALTCSFHVTQPGGSTDGKPNTICHRITKEDIQRSLKHLQVDIADVICFICGPSPMIDDTECHLLDLGVSKDAIHYEKWW